MTQKYLEVGDVIKIEHWAKITSYPITRVTKTKALSKRQSDGYEHTFQREISSNMSYPYDGEALGNFTKYTVIRKE